MKNKNTKFIIIAAILFILFIGYRINSKASLTTSSQLAINEIEHIANKGQYFRIYKGYWKCLSFR